MSEIIRVGIADMKICKAPDKITTIGLGSCVGIVIYDKLSNLGGLAHIMLPDSSKIKNNENKCKFADTCIELLVETLEENGMKRENMKAKIAGGAAMFTFATNSDVGSIGDKNVEAVRKKLSELKIKIVSEDVGLNYGRTLIFDPSTKELQVVKSGKQVKLI